MLITLPLASTLFALWTVAVQGQTSIATNKVVCSTGYGAVSTFPVGTSTLITTEKTFTVVVKTTVTPTVTLQRVVPVLTSTLQTITKVSTGTVTYDTSTSISTTTTTEEIDSTTTAVFVTATTTTIVAGGSSSNKRSLFRRGGVFPTTVLCTAHLSLYTTVILTVTAKTSTTTLTVSSTSMATDLVTLTTTSYSTYTPWIYETETDTQAGSSVVTLTTTSVSTSTATISATPIVTNGDFDAGNSNGWSSNHYGSGTGSGVYYGGYNNSPGFRLDVGLNPGQNGNVRFFQTLGTSKAAGVSYHLSFWTDILNYEATDKIIVTVGDQDTEVDTTHIQQWWYTELDFTTLGGDTVLTFTYVTTTATQQVQVFSLDHVVVTPN